MRYPGKFISFLCLAYFILCPAISYPFFIPCLLFHLDLSFLALPFHMDLSFFAFGYFIPFIIPCPAISYPFFIPIGGISCAKNSQQIRDKNRNKWESKQKMWNISGT
jgi:hypothetical protein